MNYQHIGSEVYKAEAEAIANLGAQLDERFNQACQVLLACTGRVVVTGMGKSGHIARKIASHWPVWGRQLSICTLQKPVMVI